MDKVIHEDISLQTERELTSPVSQKRPRTDCTVTNNHSGERRFDFPELWTFQKNIGSPSSKHTLQTDLLEMCPAESGDVLDDKPHKQPQHSYLIVTPFTKVTAAHTDNVHTGFSKVSFITAERHLLHLGKDEQPPLTETDKLSSYRGDDAGGALAESHTSEDTSTDTSSQPDCRRLGKSLEDEPLGGCCSPAGNDKDGRQVQTNVSQVQVFTLSSSDEEVRCQSDCAHEHALHDAGFHNTWSQSAEVKASNQTENKLEFSENIPFGKEEGSSTRSLCDYQVSKCFSSDPEENPSGNLADFTKNEKKIPEVQTFEKENVAFSEREAKIPFVAKCTKGSTDSGVMVLARNIISENASVEDDDFCGLKGEHAAGKIIAKARSEAADHTTETPMPARISEELGEGDNDPGPFSVIDPAMGSETDREAKEKCSNTESTAALERFPSVKVSERETQEVSAHDQAGHRDTEPQACYITINKTQGMDGNESSCQWKSSPSSSPRSPTKPPPAWDGGHESHRSVRSQLKEQDQSDWFPVSLDHLKTQQVEYSQTGSARMDESTEVKEGEDMIRFVKQIKTDENLEKEIKSDEELLQNNEKQKENSNEISTGDCISDWTEGDISKCNNRLTPVEHEETTEEKKRVTNVGVENKTDGQENSEVLVKIDHDLQLSHVEGTKGNMSKSDNTLSQVSQREQGNELNCFPYFQNRAQTILVESKDDLAVSTSASVSDAVVPCQNESSHSQNANNNTTAQICNDRFSPAPSVFTFYDRVPGGFDTFEKIRLSPDDDDADDDAAGLGNSPLLTSLPRQLLKTSERQLYHSMPGAESDKYEEIPGEEEVGKEKVARFQCHSDNMAHECLSSDSTCNELPNSISLADVIILGWPEQQLNCDSVCDSTALILDEMNPQSTSSTVSDESDSPSDLNVYPEFEMRKQYNMVLKELNLFFDISINDFANDSKASTPEQCSDTAEAMEGHVSNCKEHLSSPELRCHAPLDDAEEDSSLEMSGGDPVVSCTSGSCDGEQEVPFGSHTSQETSMDTAEKHKELQGMDQRRKMWSPSFACPPLFEQQFHRPPEPPRRLEPLTTCTRPIRVGLSKRAKTKHLHHPHPYK
ncbi:uncharacterized protein LOC118099147 [Hippoglossus stenolepis]|uniref:uncharacterized protein LOC118099147 n=1 Tax=Hippoglossus stenolepis TaxID=195615 RepID=UPI00159C3F5F|nr:uncharacterized protein LOC118099147 [Hippoglossus stenolepis]